ncbi:Deoxyhypusine hydroxylase, partial [Fragariocoptes setiger]
MMVNQASHILDENKENLDKRFQALFTLRNPYNTVDPTPSYPDTVDIHDLKKTYLDTSRPLFERYRALFTLRNIGTPEAVDIICAGFFCGDDDSALFKHEVAFVLGQMQDKLSKEALTKKLADLKENEMVRHECAEALGSLGESQVIQSYLKDASRIVRESCEVALDMAEYEKDESQFDFLGK